MADIDWNGRVVYIGLDLSETNDNTSVSMVSVDDSNNILSYSTRHTQYTEHANDAYGDGETAGTSITKLYAPIKVAIPKLPGVSKLMVFHGAILAGSTYDDVIVEKYIG